MKNFLLYLIGVLLLLESHAQQPLMIGDLRWMQSTILQEERWLNVHVPANYDPAKKYPVVYLLDGGMDEDLLHIAGLLQFHQMIFDLPEMIVVGIVNVDRRRDFTFMPADTEYTAEYPTAGHSDAFIRFLRDEVQPYIRDQYPVNDTAILIGQSLGGLLATQILLEQSQMFTHYCIVSPSLWWDNNALLDRAKTTWKTAKSQPSTSQPSTSQPPTSQPSTSQPRNPSNLYIAYGAGEHRILRKDARALYHLYKRHGSPSTRITLNRMAREDHASILHNAVYEYLLFLEGEE